MPLGLFIFSIFYGGMVCIAGVLGAKQVALGPLAVEAGIFPFLLLVITSSAIAELYGKARADALVTLGRAAEARAAYELARADGAAQERLAAIDALVDLDMVVAEEARKRVDAPPEPDAKPAELMAAARKAGATDRTGTTTGASRARR